MNTAAGLAYWVHFVDLAGVAVFALSGALIAAQRRMDPFGALVLAAVTGIGGGTLRDLLLDADVFWIIDPTYLWVILGTVVAAVIGVKLLHRLSRLWLPVLDAVGLAVFTMLGAHKAMLFGYDGVVVIIMGLLTGVAGGIMRDVLARQVPLVLRGDIYAVASVFGGTLYVLAWHLGVNATLAAIICVAATLALRLATIRWHLTLPAVTWIPK